MLHFTRQRNLFFSSSVLMMALALISCEPGKSLDPTPTPPVVVVPKDTGMYAKISVTAAPASVLPGDTASIELSVTDSSDGLLKGAELTVTSASFSILSASSGKAFDLDSLPDDGKVRFRIFSATPGNGTVNIKVVSAKKVSTKSIAVIITEKPVAPKIKETLPQNVAARETTLVVFAILDSALEKPLPNAVVTVSSALYTILDPAKRDTMSTDTSGNDGLVKFRVYTANAGGAGTLQVKVRTAAGLTRTVTYTLAVSEDSTQERPRKMVFTALRSSLRADGTDSTELRVLIKDDNSNPLPNEKLRFTSTGGVVKADATTDAWGMAYTTLKSERVNKTVVVTATLEKTGATAQQSVSFDGVTIAISPSKRVLMKDSINAVLFELKDGGNVPMSGDSLEIVAHGAYKGFDRNGPESLIVVTDTKGQFRTSITSQDAREIIVTARALGTVSRDTVTYTNNVLSMSASKTSINGDGLDQATVTVTLKNGSNEAIDGAELRWTTTFGNFTTSPFTLTNGSGQSSIVLRSPRGSGIAIVNVEAYTKNGNGTRSLLASGIQPIAVKALKVSKMVLKVTPDNIPVKTGETRLIAQAYDSAGNYMAGVLVGFKMIKGAGGGDESISPPVDYTKAGTAEATFRAGGVISLYRGVKLAAVALDISGTDTMIIASSDTVGLTISGPPHRISVGVNIIKGENPNDGTFSLPAAAVVTDVNGNLVADGTPVNFSTTPVAALYLGESYTTIKDWPFYALGDTAWYFLPWSDYNDNGRLDADEEVSPFDLTRTRPYRGEDQDGNGVINFPPESFEDINHNGVWDGSNAEPLIPTPPTDTSGIKLFVDFNKNGKRDTAEPFEDYDYNGDHICQCAGQRDTKGALYEISHFGSTANHPFPGEVSVGIPRQIPSEAGKATTKVTYVQSMANQVKVRVTAESNGIRAYVDVILPIVKDEE